MNSAIARFIGFSCAIACLAGNALAQEDVLEEVLVTAQKRTQRAQDVSIALTAYSEEEIRKLRFVDATDVSSLVPNVTALTVTGNNNVNFVIRGVGLNDIAPNNGSPTAVHLDEVYYNFGVMLNFALFDLERVEVLRGPQGTLYGRNTTAGAVNFISKRPGREFDAQVRTSYGNYENLMLEGHVNLPLSPTVSTRFSGTYRDQSEGPFYNRFLDTDQGAVDKYGWRAQLNFHPSETFEVNLNVHGGSEDSDLYHYSAAVTGNGAGGFCAPYFAGPLHGNDAGCVGFLGETEPDTDPFTTAAGQLPVLEIDSVGAVLTIDWETPIGTLTSVSGAESLDRFIAEDADGFPEQIVDDYFENDIETYSQEVRLASLPDAGALSWIVGLYWSSDDLGVPRHEAKSFFARNLGVNSIYEQKGESTAAFAHTEFKLSDAVRFNAGLRYTEETREWTGGSWLTTGDPNPNTSPTTNLVQLAQRSESKDFSATSGKLGIDYFVNEDFLLYGFAAKGFRSGGFNGNLAFASAAITSFDQETLYDYEIGAKTSWLDGRVIWNTGVFYYDYEDVQLIGNFEVIGPGGLPANLFTLSNLSDAEVKGIETELGWRPTERLEIRLAAGWLDAKLVNPKPGNEALEDNEMANSPPFTFSGMFRYMHPVSSTLQASAQLDFAHKDDYFANISNLPVIAIEGSTVVNARIALGEAQTGNWELALWAKNLLDEEYATYAVDLASTRRTLRTYGYPLTYGIEFLYRWD